MGPQDDPGTLGWAESKDVKLTIQSSLLPLGKLRFGENRPINGRQESAASVWLLGRDRRESLPPPQLILLDRFPSHTPPSLEAAARGAGNLASLRSQPNIQRFPTPQTGHYLPVNTASYLLGLLWKPNPEGKEGGHSHYRS